MNPSLQTSLARPYGSRNAARLLRERLLDCLVSERLSEGTRLGTENEFGEAARLSRSTVRRAIDPLVAEGWLQRRVGAGTFVGGRAPTGPVDRPAGGAATTAAASGAGEPAGSRTLRVAVLLHRIGDLSNDWYSPRVIEGMDEAAHDLDATLELLGDRDVDGDALSRRLMRSMPDALVALTGEARHAFLLRDAERVGIKCFVSGTPLSSLGLPCVHEDNRQGMELAVDHLLERGHRRIGLILQRRVEPWVFDRHEAFCERAQAAGLGDADCPVLWLPQDAAGTDREMITRVEAFLRQNRLSAVIPANDLSMRCLDALVTDRRLNVPEDLSVISFEQDHRTRHWLGLDQPTTVSFPLREIGRRLMAGARAACSEQNVQNRTVLPFSPSCRHLGRRRARRLTPPRFSPPALSFSFSARRSGPSFPHPPLDLSRRGGHSRGSARRSSLSSLPHPPQESPSWVFLHGPLSGRPSRSSSCWSSSPSSPCWSASCCRLWVPPASRPAACSA